MAKIPYKDRVTYTTPTCNRLPEALINVPVLAEIKLWRKKFFHVENGVQVGKGDDVTFILAFGNDGELPCTASAGNPTVEDTLEIQYPIDLKLMSLCIGHEYELWVVAETIVNGPNPVSAPVPAPVTPYRIKRCHIFQSGVYTLQLRKKRPSCPTVPATPYFDIPCHYACCLSMVLQLEFPACPACPDDCHGRISNGSFEIGPYCKNGVITDWDVTLASDGDGDQFAKEVSFFMPKVNVPPYVPYTPVNGTHFALLKTDGPCSYTSISQTIYVCSGDTINGWAFFATDEHPAPNLFPDNAQVLLYDKNNFLIHTLFTATASTSLPFLGTTPWTSFIPYTFTQSGTYKLVCRVKNVGDSFFDSYLGVDAIKLTK